MTKGLVTAAGERPPVGGELVAVQDAGGLLGVLAGPPPLGDVAPGEGEWEPDFTPAFLRWLPEVAPAWGAPLDPLPCADWL